MLAKHGRWSRGDARRLLEQTEKALASAETSAARRAISRQAVGELCRIAERRGDTLAKARRNLAAALPQLSPRGRATAALLDQALTDTEAELCLDAPTAMRVRSAFERAEKIAAELARNTPAAAAATSQYNDTTYAASRAIDGDPGTSWLCKDRAPLPQVLTITLRHQRRIDYVRIVQGAYHLAYNTRAYRIEHSADGRQFAPLAAGELENRLGAVQAKRVAPVEVLAIRVVVDSVYPNVDYSAPSLSEIDLGQGDRSWLTSEAGR